MVSAADQEVPLADGPLHRQKSHLDDVILDLRYRLGSRPMQLVAVPYTAENLGMADRKDRCCPYPPVFHSVAPQSTNSKPAFTRATGSREWLRTVRQAS